MVFNLLFILQMENNQQRSTYTTRPLTLHCAKGSVSCHMLLRGSVRLHFSNSWCSSPNDFDSLSNSGKSSGQCGKTIPSGVPPLANPLTALGAVHWRAVRIRDEGAVISGMCVVSYCMC